MLYEPRESINPRTFALRHVLLEELKLRSRRSVGADATDPWAALARALDVSYDAAARQFVVRGVGDAACTVPLDALRLYEPRTDTTTVWQREDEILRANRALAARLIDELSAPPPETP